MNFKSLHIAMSHVDSLDEETKRILAEVNSDVQSGTDDSKESDKSKKNEKQKENKNNEYNEFEEDDRDPLQDSSLDDKEW